MFIAAYFTCIVKVLYNLLYYQVLTQMSCSLTEPERTWILANIEFARDYKLCNALGLVLNSLRYTGLYDTESIQPSTSQTMTKVNLHALEQKVE